MIKKRKKGSGGKREGAGRPKGTGRFRGEPTKAIRVPVSKISEILELIDPGNVLITVKTANGFEKVAVGGRTLLYIQQLETYINNPKESRLKEVYKNGFPTNKNCWTFDFEDTNPKT